MKEKVNIYSMKISITQIGLFILLIFIGNSLFAQKDYIIPIQTIKDSVAFSEKINQIKKVYDALYVFDIDNTLLITNENGFGSDWWYSQTKGNPNLKLNISDDCLFNILTPLFYSTFNSTGLFHSQSESVDSLGHGDSRTIALTSRAYSPVIANATELQLKKNNYDFLQKDSADLAPHVKMLNSVIYTRGQNKGVILLNYVKDKNYKKIYFFDDSKSKVKDVQKAFSGQSYDIELYHMKVASKIPYTSKQVEGMQTQLCNLIEFIRELGSLICSCKTKYYEN